MSTADVPFAICETHFALLLQKTGRPAEAATLFADVAKLSKARGVVLTQEDQEWIKVAQRNLAAG